MTTKASRIEAEKRTEILDAFDLGPTRTLEQDIEFEIQKADSLRQSILKKAFSGRLVAQDPNDEPARLLLERINAWKASIENGKKKLREEDAA